MLLAVVVIVAEFVVVF